MRTGRKFVVALTSVLACACATNAPAPSYKLYPGPVRPASELAIVHLGDAGTARFDGRVAERRDWSEVQLLPGEHTIEWIHEFGVSVMIEPSGFATGGDRATVTLEADHRYTLRADRTTGPGYRMYFWIVDDATGRVVFGEPKK